MSGPFHRPLARTLQQRGRNEEKCIVIPRAARQSTEFNACSLAAAGREHLHRGQGAVGETKGNAETRIGKLLHLAARSSSRVKSGDFGGGHAEARPLYGLIKRARCARYGNRFDCLVSVQNQHGAVGGLVNPFFGRTHALTCCLLWVAPRLRGLIERLTDVYPLESAAGAQEHVLLQVVQDEIGRCDGLVGRRLRNTRATQQTSERTRKQADFIVVSSTRWHRIEYSR